jgi:hypothetical protein
MLWLAKSYPTLPSTFRYRKLYWIGVFATTTTPVCLKCWSSGPTYLLSSLLGKMKSHYAKSFPVHRLGDKPFLMGGGVSPTTEAQVQYLNLLPVLNLPMNLLSMNLLLLTSRKKDREHQEREEEFGGPVFVSMGLTRRKRRLFSGFAWPM